jgi:cytochrome c oxidase subunit 5b
MPYERGLTQPTPTPTPTSPSPLPPIALAMFLQRSAVAAARRVAPRAIARRTFTTTFVRRRSRLESATMYH